MDVGRLQRKVAAKKAKKAKKALKDFPSTEKDLTHHKHSECDCHEESDSLSEPDEEVSSSSSSEEDISEYGGFFAEADQSQSDQEILEDKGKKSSMCTLRFKHKKGKVEHKKIKRL